MANRTVLIIDDDDDGRAICAAILGHHGYRVLEAATAAAGLDLAARARPDLILANLLLPDLHGWEVRDRLAADPRTSVIPAIAFTGDVRQETRQRCLACGFTFTDRAPRRFQAPSRCPQCRSERISEPRFRIE